MAEIINYEASREIYGSAINCLKDERGVHAETAVAAISAVCGEELLRACKIDLSQFPPGEVVSLELVRDGGSKMLSYLEELLNELLVEHSDDWSAQVPAEHSPHRDPLRLAVELRPQMQTLFEKHGLSDEQAAQVACMALALLIRDCQKVLQPAISVLIASNVIGQTARSAPLLNAS